MKKAMKKKEEEYHEAFKEHFDQHPIGPPDKIEWKTILVGDKMGQIVKLSKKGRDQSEEWESLQEKWLDKKKIEQEEKENKYKEGKLFKSFAPPPEKAKEISLKEIKDNIRKDHEEKISKIEEDK
jgi:hypothetical protein